MPASAPSTTFWRRRYRHCFDLGKLWHAAHCATPGPAQDGAPGSWAQKKGRLAWLQVPRLPERLFFLAIAMRDLPRKVCKRTKRYEMRSTKRSICNGCSPFLLSNKIHSLSLPLAWRPSHTPCTCRRGLGACRTCESSAANRPQVRQAPRFADLTAIDYRICLNFHSGMPRVCIRKSLHTAAGATAHALHAHAAWRACINV